MNLSIKYLRKLMSSSFNEFFFENAYTKYMALCNDINHMDMFFNFVSTILLHEFVHESSLQISPHI